MIPATSVPLFAASLDPLSVQSSTSAAGHISSVTHSIDILKTPGATSSGLSPASATGSAPFADLITEAVGQVQQLEQQSKTAIQGLISGKGVDVHEAMIASQKAGMGFELMLSVRNKALAAYQQVLGMQF